MSVKLFSFMLFFSFSTGFVYCPPPGEGGGTGTVVDVVGEDGTALCIQVIVSDPVRLRELGGLQLTVGRGLAAEGTRGLPGRDFVAERPKIEWTGVWYQDVLSVVRKDGRDSLRWTAKGTFVLCGVLAFVDVWCNDGNRLDQVIKLLGKTKVIHKVVTVVGFLVSLNGVVDGLLNPEGAFRGCGLRSSGLGGEGSGQR